MKQTSCVVIDYGIGNVFSVMHALNAQGVSAQLSGNSTDIRDADRVILPGVGAFGRAARRIRSLGLDDDILKFIETGRPFLGICVGMQLLMTQGTEFGLHDGLNLISGSVDKIDLQTAEGQKHKVPLIGWYPLELNPDNGAKDNSIFAGTPTNAAYYFVHSFSCRPDDPDVISGEVDHSGQRIVAAVQRDNMIGVQFHPERSGSDGLSVIQRFLSM